MTTSLPTTSLPSLARSAAWPHLAARGGGARTRLELPANDLIQGWLHQVGVESSRAFRKLNLRRHAVSCFIVSAPIACVLSSMVALLSRLSLPTPTSLAEGMAWTWATTCVLAAWARIAVLPLAAGTVRSLRRRQRLETLLLVRRLNPAERVGRRRRHRESVLVMPAAREAPAARETVVLHVLG